MKNFRIPELMQPFAESLEHKLSEGETLYIRRGKATETSFEFCVLNEKNQAIRGFRASIKGAKIEARKDDARVYTLKLEKAGKVARKEK